MNFIEISKLIMSGEKIYNLPLRVCFYARVSTDSDVQLNSLDNQLNYYKNFIKSKFNWTYVDGYVDEGVSGVRVEKRKAFQKMIQDACLHKFDLIVTKEVSRFARDLEDSIHYIRILKEANVGIYFENQNLNTFDINSELILNIMFNLAQDESRKLSSRVKFGHREAIRKGHVLGSSNIIGYKKDNCKLVVDLEEAKFIVNVFELYASGEYGFYKLSKKLASLGFFNKNGNFYDKDTLKRIISNPKYKGFYRGKTSEVIDYRTKKRIKIDCSNQIIYRCSDDIVPSIVSEELWDKANEILKNRTKNYFYNNCFSGGLKYPLSSKVFCKEHSVSFQRSHGNKKKNRPTWCCGMYLQYGLVSCISPIIAEKDLYMIIGNIMNNIIPSKDKIICDMVKIYEDVDISNQYGNELSEIENNIKIIENKKTMLLDLVFDGSLRKDDLKVQFDCLLHDLSILSNKKKRILEQMKIINKIHDSNRIYAILKEEISGGFIDEFIRNFVDEIIVSKIDDDRYNLHLDIFLNLFSSKKGKIKGARHINGKMNNEIIFFQNQKFDSVEKLRSDRKINSFTYNVFLGKF